MLQVHRRKRKTMIPFLHQKPTRINEQNTYSDGLLITKGVNDLHANHPGLNIITQVKIIDANVFSR
jgi:hypothetical protein